MPKKIVVIVLISVAVLSVVFIVLLTQERTGNIREHIEREEALYKRAFAEIDKLDEAADTVTFDVDVPTGESEIIDGRAIPTYELIPRSYSIEYIIESYQQFREDERQANITYFLYTIGACAVFLLCLFLLFLTLTWNRRCPNCKKLLALVRGKPVNIGNIKTEYEAEHADVTIDKWGVKRVAVEDRKVRYNYSAHKIPYTCKRCNFVDTRTMTGN